MSSQMEMANLFGDTLVLRVNNQIDRIWLKWRLISVVLAVSFMPLILWIANRQDGAVTITQWWYPLLILAFVSTIIVPHLISGRLCNAAEANYGEELLLRCCIGNGEERAFSKTLLANFLAGRHIDPCIAHGLEIYFYQKKPLGKFDPDSSNEIFMTLDEARNAVDDLTPKEEARLARYLA